MSIVRDLTLKLQEHFPEDEVVLMVGARQSGKTTILRQLEQVLKQDGQAYHFLNLEDPDYLSLLNQSPKNLFQIFPFDLKRRTFLLVDEVQYLNNPTNFLKYFYDQYRGRIKIIATGSSAFYLDKKFKDSLAGRKRLYYVLTLSFREFLRFKNELELSTKNLTKLTLTEKEKTQLYYQEYLLFGGYPQVVLTDLDKKEKLLEELVYSYIKKDVFESNIRQDDVFYRLLKILASQVGNLINASELASTLSVSKTAVDKYLYVMQKSFHLRLVKPFFTNLRKELTKMPKVYFLDLGLRNFLMRNFQPYHDRQDKGPLLENACYRQLLEGHDFEDISFWRTASGNEVDFVVRGKKAFEVKVQPEKFRASKYKTFFKNYPEIKLSLITLDKQKKEISGHDILNLWEL